MRKALTCITFVAAMAGQAVAGPHDFVVEHAGVGGTQQQAAPYIKKFLEYCEQALGWPAGSSTGDFFPDPDADFSKHLSQKKPGLGMLDPDQVLELRKKEELTVIATVVGKNQSLGQLHLVVKDPKLKTLDDLKGKSVISAHLQSPKFISKIAFEGKADAARYFAKLQPASSMLKAVKAVDRGEADAALLSDGEMAALKGMAYPDLHPIWASEKLPPMPVVAFNKNVTPKERDAFAKMLLGMCSDPKGAEVCKALDIDKFTPPEKAVYDAAFKRFDK